MIRPFFSFIILTEFLFSLYALCRMIYFVEFSSIYSFQQKCNWFMRPTHFPVNHLIMQKKMINVVVFLRLPLNIWLGKFRKLCHFSCILFHIAYKYGLVCFDSCRSIAHNKQFLQHFQIANFKKSPNKKKTFPSMYCGLDTWLRIAVIIPIIKMSSVVTKKSAGEYYARWKSKCWP